MATVHSHSQQPHLLVELLDAEPLYTVVLGQVLSAPQPGPIVHADAGQALGLVPLVTSVIRINVK